MLRRVPAAFRWHPIPQGMVQNQNARSMSGRFHLGTCALGSRIDSTLCRPRAGLTIWIRSTLPLPSLTNHGPAAALPDFTKARSHESDGSPLSARMTATSGSSKDLDLRLTKHWRACCRYRNTLQSAFLAEVQLPLSQLVTTVSALLAVR
jgi:hypothetical protein